MQPFTWHESARYDACVENRPHSITSVLYGNNYCPGRATYDTDAGTGRYVSSFLVARWRT
jgi:hypothetical protein